VQTKADAKVPVLGGVYQSPAAHRGEVAVTPAGTLEGSQDLLLNQAAKQNNGLHHVCSPGRE